jgi:hypothetical protein
VIELIGQFIDFQLSIFNCCVVKQTSTKYITNMRRQKMNFCSFHRILQNAKLDLKVIIKESSRNQNKHNAKLHVQLNVPEQLVQAAQVQVLLCLLQSWRCAAGSGYACV